LVRQCIKHKTTRLDVTRDCLNLNIVSIDLYICEVEAHKLQLSQVDSQASALALPLPLIGPKTSSPSPRITYNVRTRRRLRSPTCALRLRGNSFPLLVHSLQGVRRPCRNSFPIRLNLIQPWPIVERFLKEQVDGAVGADVGCGNGKYLAVNKAVFIVGSDRYVHHVSQ
jgi:hypothetical protein